MINHYPEPFSERYPRISPRNAKLNFRGTLIGRNFWEFILPNGDAWHINAVSFSTALIQAKQLYRFTVEGIL